MPEGWARRLLGVVLWAALRRADALAAGRMRSPPGAAATGTGREKAPPVWGPAGPFKGEYYLVGSLGLGAGKGSGSKSSQPTGIVNTLPSATVTCSVVIDSELSLFTVNT